MEKMEPPPSYTSPPYPYPQPPPSMPQPSMPPPPPHTVHIITNMAFGKDSQRIICPHCHADISTRVETQPNTKTHLMALFLCLFLCWCCAPCPYCIDSCMVQNHYCPACSSFLGASDN